MSKTKCSLPRILVVEDVEYWREKLAMMFCRILRQVKVNNKSAHEITACLKCSFAKNCRDLTPETPHSTAPRDELVSTAADTSQAMVALDVSREEQKAKKRNFDVLSLDLNLGDGATGDDIVTYAVAGDRRIAIIAISGFRNDARLQKKLQKKYDRLWNLRQHLERKSNGACLVYEKVHPLQESLAQLWQHLDDHLPPEDPGRASYFELLHKIGDSESLVKLSRQEIDKQIHRIERSLSLADIIRLVKETDCEARVNASDHLCLHFGIPDEGVPRSMGKWAGLSLSENGRLTLAGVKLEDLDHFTNWERFHQIHDEDDVLLQLGTRLSYLASTPEIAIYCSIQRHGETKEPSDELHAFDFGLAPRVLLARLCANRFRMSARHDSYDEAQLTIRGFRDPSDNPFPERFEGDLTPRNRYREGTKGNLGKTPDAKHLSESIQPFLKALLKCTDNPVVESNQRYYLRLNVSVFLHRQSSLSLQKKPESFKTLESWQVGE